MKAGRARIHPTPAEWDEAEAVAEKLQREGGISSFDAVEKALGNRRFCRDALCEKVARLKVEIAALRSQLPAPPPKPRPRPTLVKDAPPFANPSLLSEGDSA